MMLNDCFICFLFLSLVPNIKVKMKLTNNITYKSVALYLLIFFIYDNHGDVTGR